MGYIRDGCFNLLFSASSPPLGLKKLEIGRILYPAPRMPGPHTPNREATISRFTPTLSPSNDPYVPSIVSSPSGNPDMDFRMLGSGSSVRFVFKEEQGAALVTKYRTFKENTQEIGKFKKHTKNNYASWVEFARNDGHGDVNPILVTGVDRTKDFAMMCYSGYRSLLECSFKTSASSTTSASPWGRWETARPIYENHGPQQCRPPSTQAIDLTPSGSSREVTDSDENNQCVFVRYFIMLPRVRWLPRVIRAAAGPHNLSPGGYDGEGSPLRAQEDPGPSSDISTGSLDDDQDGDMSSVTSTDSASSTVIHNPTTVRYLSPSPPRPF